MAGRKLSQVPMKLVSDVIELARSYNAPVALDLLLRQAGISSENALVTPTKVEAGPLGVIAHWFVVVDQKGFVMESGSKGSALLGSPIDNALRPPPNRQSTNTPPRRKLAASRWSRARTDNGGSGKW